MCGINLIVDLTGNIKPDALERMMEKTRHRGPDSNAMKIIRKPGYQLLFGVNRLCIIDRDKSSDQPFTRNDDPYFLLFNGEIYNQADIRNELIGGDTRFLTFSDTEVLYHFLKNNPSPDHSRLHGMYAYVFLDLLKESLSIARDPWGMKPLYYFKNDQYLIVSSEIQGILASGLVDRILNADQIPNYLRYRYTGQPDTLIKHVHSFLKGKRYRFNLQEFELKISADPLAGRDVHDDNFQEIRYKEDDQILKEVEEHLVDSLINHTQSVHPPGLFLSGGVDSTLLLALAANNGVFLPHVFSVVNKEKDRTYGTADDKYVKMAVGQYHPSAHILELDHSIMHEIEGFINDMDHPVADPAFFLTWWLSKHTAGITRVVLSGTGADELFAGYHRHSAFQKYLRHYRMLNFLSPAVKSVLDHVPSGYGFSGRKKIVLYKKLFSKLTSDPWQTYDNFLSLDKLHPPLTSVKWDQHQMELALERDREEYLPEDLLVVGDRACMLNSVEMRMPYLDERFSRYVRGIPPGRLLKKGKKWLLKTILEKNGGREYARRSKEGFGFPFGHWIRNPEYGDLLKDVTGKENVIYQYIDKVRIVDMIKKHMSGMEDNAQEIWSVFVLDAWIRKNFN